MIKISFPDGASKSFKKNITGLEVAETISSSLKKKCLAMKIDNELVDVFLSIEKSCSIEFVTKDSPEALGIIRHDCAHLLAQAIKQLYPKTQITIGPVIENGFYYDISPQEPLSTDDFVAIEKKMQQLVEQNLETKREILSREQAVEYFQAINETYKVQLIKDLPAGEALSIYSHGEWKDLCKGPHLPSTKFIGKAFKLTHLAGAYWRGNSNNEMLQRIYGTCFINKQELDDYLFRLEESKRRDHRKIGKALGYFHLQEEAQGSVFWHPEGYKIWLEIEAYIRKKLKQANYQEIRTPQLLDAKLWQTSGHWEKFRENMFVVPDEVPSLNDNEPLITGKGKMMALKPMNCPAHIQVFKQGIRSYKELPLRFSEFGCCHRNEAHGALHGLMRVRQMTQDDGHIFCTEDQLLSESINFCNLLGEIYKDFGFENYFVKLATRPEKRTGTDEVWDKSEKAMAQALQQLSINFEIAQGEGAFYGPKLEFHLTDAIGRSWQCGTLQCDFNLPKRLGASFINSQGVKETPVMLHRAILGTFERFIGILIEHYDGKLPLWLAPVQIAIAPIVSDLNDYADEINKKLELLGVRTFLDIRNEKLNFKIRDHAAKKIPITIIIGKQEQENQSVTLRFLGQKQQENLGLVDAVVKIKHLIALPGEK